MVGIGGNRRSIMLVVAVILVVVAPATSRSKQKEHVYDYNLGVPRNHRLDHFTDMKEEEVGGSSYSPEHDLIDPTYKLAVDKYMQHDVDDDDLPQSVDWRSKGAVTSVKNQRGCGGSWAFAAAAAIEGIHFIENGELVSLSVQQLLDCSFFDKGCVRGNAARAFRYVTMDGMEAWDTMPFVGYNRTCRFQLDPIVYLTDYQFVTPNSTRALMEEVARQPVVVGLHTNTLFGNYTHGVFRGPCHGKGNHQVTVVGYGTTPEGLDYWTVKTSWGVGFGEQGYMKIERGHDKEGGLCGILQTPVYPIGPVTVED